MSPLSSRLLTATLWEFLSALTVESRFCELCVSRFLFVKAADGRGMLGVLFLCCAIGFVCGQTGPNSTTTYVQINETIVFVSELVTNSYTTVSGAELTTDSTVSAAVWGLNTTSSEDTISDARRCPRNSSKPCVVKCCPLGQSVGPKKACEPSALKFDVHFFGENETYDDDEEYDYIFGDPCSYGR